MRRLTITHQVLTPEDVQVDPLAFVAPDGTTMFRIAGAGDGLDQIAAYAREIAAQTGETVVHFEVFWPWETEEQQTWDALAVDVSKIDKADPDDWWATTLPPYAELTVEQRTALGIEGYDADPA